MSTLNIPEPTKKRFVQLLQILKDWPNKKITSVDISDATGWKTTLIRHDLWLAGFNKGVSNGYVVDELLHAINQTLGLETSDTNSNQIGNVADVNSFTDSFSVGNKNLCIAGLGRLGAALLDDSVTANSIFQIKAGFDTNVNRVEILRSTFPLYPASEMDFVVKKEKIKYALLTVSDKDAQNMANRLVKAGIKGIVNLTNVILKVPIDVKVENLSIQNALNMVI